ncbi:MAG: hypothetical protein ACI9FZ_000636 [Bacteroidia bacterium]
MNINNLEQQLMEQLRELLSNVDCVDQIDVLPVGNSPDLGYDIVATLRPPDGNGADLLVECKELPRPSQFPFAQQESRLMNTGTNTSVPVLAAPWISPRMAELCDQHGWGWFDLAGNCHLRIPGVLYMERTGYKPVHKRNPAQANLSTAESARIIRALLTDKDPSRKWTQRSLRDACTPEVSLGLVNKVVRYLKDQAYLMDLENGRGFKLHDPLGLLKVWSQHYRFDQHVRYEYFTLNKNRTVCEQMVEQLAEKDGQYALSVFSAATEQAAHVRGEIKLWLYLERNLLDEFKRVAEASAVDTGANVVVLIPEDTGVFAGKQITHSAEIPCTHPIQTYIDLKQAGGRGEEAAEALLEQRIKPEWKKANLVW